MLLAGAYMFSFPLQTILKGLNFSLVFHKGHILFFFATIQHLQLLIKDEIFGFPPVEVCFCTIYQHRPLNLVVTVIINHHHDVLQSIDQDKNFWVDVAF